MVKEIPYSNYVYDFEIDSIIDVSNNHVYNSKCPTLKILNKTSKYSKDWVKYITLYNIYLPDWAENKLFDIKFSVYANYNINLDPIACYTNTPILYPLDSKYRLIPRYPREE